MKRSFKSTLNVCLVLTTIQMTAVKAEEKRESAPERLTIKSAEQTAWRSLQTLVNGEEQYLKARGSKAAFLRMAEGMVASAEKFKQAADLVNGYDGRMNRVRSLFERNVVSQEVVQKRLHKAFADLQLRLLKDTVQLCLQQGVPLKKVEQIQVLQLKAEAFSSSYRPLIQHGAKVAQSDWFRTGAAVIAAGAASGVAESAARELGLWNHKEGGFMDMLLGAAVEAASHAIVDQVSDPTPGISKSLKSGFDQVTKSLLHGKNGLNDTCRQLIEYHIDTRKKLVGGMKGGAK